MRLIDVGGRRFRRVPAGVCTEYNVRQDRTIGDSTVLEERGLLVSVSVWERFQRGLSPPLHSVCTLQGYALALGKIKEGWMACSSTTAPCHRNSAPSSPVQRNSAQSRPALVQGALDQAGRPWLVLVTYSRAVQADGYDVGFCLCSSCFLMTGSGPDVI